MGKASRWIRNFLLVGKKEDNKYKKMSETSELGSPVVLLTSENCKVKRRWSFKRKSTDAKPTMHKSTRSFDSMFVPKQTSIDYETHVPLHAHAAATMIQAAYRSYLARRALRALRALVKLQALTRGHLVRKQMNTVARSMHAVIAIQVRARIHRSRNAMQPRRRSYSTMVASDKLESENKEKLKSKSGRSTDHHTSLASLEYNSRICNSSSRMSVSQREYRLKMPPSPTMSQTDSSSMSYDGLIERRYSTWPQNPIARNYMSNTESSKAKARSHSEPKQRPKQSSKSKGRKSLSIDGKNDEENRYPWLGKFYHRANTYSDCEDLDSNVGDMKSMSPFEPPMIFY